MSNSVRPHRWQPTRLPRPWDSPGKNTGVGFHFLLQCMKVKSESEATQSCPTLSYPIDSSPPGSAISGILQARTLEWVAISFFNAWKWKVKVCHDIFSDEREEPTTKTTLLRKTFIQIWWRNQKLSRQAKVKRIQHHQTSFTTSAKGTSLCRKHKRRKRSTNNKPKTLKKMVTESLLLLLLFSH